MTYENIFCILFYMFLTYKYLKYPLSRFKKNTF